MHVMLWLKLLKTGKAFPYSLFSSVTQPEAEDVAEDSDALWDGGPHNGRNLGS